MDISHKDIPTLWLKRGLTHVANSQHEPTYNRRRTAAIDHAAPVPSGRTLRRTGSVQVGRCAASSREPHDKDGADAGGRRGEAAHYRSSSGTAITCSYSGLPDVLRNSEFIMTQSLSVPCCTFPLRW